MNLPLTAADLLQRFDHPSVQAIALLGSYARDDAGPFSDVDLLRLVAVDAPELPDNGTHLIDGWLVNVSSATPAGTRGWFERPEEAVSHIAGLRVARVLVDRNGALAGLQARAHAFVWDATMQGRADRWASRQLVGWAEEAHKGLEGLRRGDVGRLLNARHGCSWGLNHVIQVQRGVLVSGDNAVYDEVGAAMADQPEWLRLRRLAFGLEDAAGTAPTIAEQVRAGLRLYALTAELLDATLQPEDRPIIALTVARISEGLVEQGVGARFL
jgi:hypothetical protein